MMLRRNVASQSFILPGALIALLDGAAVASGSLTIYKDGAGAAAAGVLSHTGNGVYSYTPTAGETDCQILGWKLTGTGAMPLSGTMRTTAADPNDGSGFGLSRLDASVQAVLSAVMSVQNNTFIATTIPPVLERPDTGSNTISIVVVFADDTGTATNLDSGNPGIAVFSDAGTDRSGRLGTWSNPATGKYVIPYTNSAGDALEWLNWEITGTINSKLRRFPSYTQLVDTSAVDFTTADRTKLNQLAADYTTARAGKLDFLDASILSRLAASSYSDAPTATDNANGLLDLLNGVETGLTFRQALRLLVAAAAGKLSGAATTTILIRNIPDTKDRITATVDASGNRSAVVLDLT